MGGWVGTDTLHTHPIPAGNPLMHLGHPPSPPPTPTTGPPQLSRLKSLWQRYAGDDDRLLMIAAQVSVCQWVCGWVYAVGCMRVGVGACVCHTGVLPVLWRRLLRCHRTLRSCLVHGTARWARAHAGPPSASPHLPPAPKIACRLPSTKHLAYHDCKPLPHPRHPLHRPQLPGGWTSKDIKRLATKHGLMGKGIGRGGRWEAIGL